MSKNTLHNELDIRRDFFEEKHLQEYLEHVAEMLEISRSKFCIKFGTKKGDNYMGIIYRIFIEGEKNSVPVKVSTILKAPSREISRASIHRQHLFFREHIFYSEIVPVFRELLLRLHKVLENIPRSYFSSGVHHKEAIYLEDLKPLGFVMCDRIKQMDFAHMSLTFSALGRFHALSFALRDQKPGVFASKVTTLEESLFRPDFINNPAFMNRFKERENLVKMALAEEDPSYTEKYIEFTEYVLRHIEWSCTGIHAEPYTVLAHGDVWTNNLMFKYDKDSVEPKDLYFLDFQLARYASPATYISYTLYSSCNQELREKHFDEFINIYYESLSNYLRELGSNPKKLFPYDALLDQLKQFSRITAVSLTLILSSITSQGNDVQDDPSGNNDILY